MTFLAKNIVLNNYHDLTLPNTMQGVFFTKLPQNTLMIGSDFRHRRGKTGPIYSRSRSRTASCLSFFVSGGDASLAPVQLIIRPKDGILLFMRFPPHSDAPSRHETSQIKTRPTTCKASTSHQPHDDGSAAIQLDGGN